jgi:hypothetical protein
MVVATPIFPRRPEILASLSACRVLQPVWQLSSSSGHGFSRATRAEFSVRLQPLRPVFVGCHTGSSGRAADEYLRANQFPQEFPRKLAESERKTAPNAT